MLIDPSLTLLKSPMSRKSAFVVFPVLLLLFCLYYWLSENLGANSDNMSSLLIAQDLVDGNLRLQGWTLSTQSYLFSNIIWAALLIKAIGFHPELAHAIPAFFYTVTVFFSYLIAENGSKRGAILIIPFLLVPTYFSTNQTIEMNVHGGMYASSVLTICLYYMKSDIRVGLGSLFFLMASLLVAYSDSLIIYTLFIPTSVASAVYFYLHRDAKYLRLLAFSIASIGLAKVSGRLIGSFFDYDIPGLGPAHLADFSQIIRNVAYLYQGVTKYFAITFTSDWIENSLSVFHSMCLVFLAYCLIKSVRNYRRYQFVDYLLVFAFLIPVAAFLVSTVPVDDGSTRVIYFSILCLFVFLARNTNIGAGAYRSYLALMLLWGVSNIYSSLTVVEPAHQQFKRLADFLSEQDLKVGYATYWNASVTTALGDVHVIPVDIDSLVRPKHWLSKQDWFQKDATFLVVSTADEEAAALAQLGTPDRTMVFEGRDILVWDQMPSLLDGIRIDPLRGDIVNTGASVVTDDGVYAKGIDGFMLSGPYVDLAPGQYRVTVLGTKASGNAKIEIFSGLSGFSHEESITKGDGVLADFTLDVPRYLKRVELRIDVDTTDELLVTGYSITPTGEGRGL